MSEKSNFSFIPIIIIALAIGLSKCDRIMYSLNNKNKSNFEIRHTTEIPKHFKILAKKILEENKIKLTNLVHMKPINPHK